MTARRLALALLLAAALAPASAAEGGILAEFEAPAQADGTVAVSGEAQWAILVFRGGSSGAFGMDLAPGGSATNHTRLKWHAGETAYYYDGGPPPSQMALPDPVQGRLETVAGAWGSLYVEADRLQVESSGVHAVLRPAERDRLAGAYLPAGIEGDGVYRYGQAVAEDGVGIAVEGDARADFAFRLVADGVRRLEWHNATLACSGPGACPGSPSQRVQAGGGPALVDVLAFTEVEAPGGTLEGAGQAFLAAVGGPSVGLAVDGRLRLPAASLAGDCRGVPCPDPSGKTFLAEGNLSLSGLSPSPSEPRRLRGGLDGAFAASFDESPVAGFGPAQGVAIGVAAAGLALLLKGALALLSKKSRPNALEHPKRQALHDLIRSEPGLSFRELRRRLHWPNGTLVNHLDRLEDARLVTRRPYRNTVRYFEAQGRFGSSWDELVLLRDPDLRSLHGWLQAHPASSQGDVLRQAEQWGWRRSTTQDRLRALVEGRLVERTARGRVVHYTIRMPPNAADNTDEAATVVAAAQA